jgi:hypothetical protein
MKTNFTETQKFTQWWLWLILIAVSAIPFYAIVQQIILDQGPFGNKSMPNEGLIITGLVMASLILLFYVLRLETQINKTSIYFKFFPFVSKTILWEEVNAAKVIDYGFVGGWGIRLWTGYGTVYNVRGSKGLLVELKSGKQFIIGTQKEKELTFFIEQLETKSSENSINN